MQKQLWDKKAQTFPRFVKDSKDTLEILAFFRAQGVDFRDKNVLDIGAGNGRFALQLAFEASHLYASDISDSMLRHLANDAKDLGLANITTILSPWEECDISKLRLDIAFAAMTPALNNFASFKKALCASKEGLCYVGWGRVRQSAFLDEIFAQHNMCVELPTGLPQVLQWLSELKMEIPTYCYKEANYTYSANLDKAIEDITWHIHIHGGSPDEEKIRQFVASKQQNGLISYLCEREIGLCFIPANI